MITKEILLELNEYVNVHSKHHSYAKSCTFMAESCERKLVSEVILPVELESFVSNKRSSSFQQILFSYIDEKSAKDTDIYKKVGIDRRLFSKIRSNQNYRPSKNTVIALALALELNKEDTCKLLNSSGHSLSDWDTFDLVIQFCLDKGIYDINEVNMALDYFSLKPLGAASE